MPGVTWRYASPHDPDADPLIGRNFEVPSVLLRPGMHVWTLWHQDRPCWYRAVIEKMRKMKDGVHIGAIRILYSNKVINNWDFFNERWLFMGRKKALCNKPVLECNQGHRLSWAPINNVIASATVETDIECFGCNQAVAGDRAVYYCKEEKAHEHEDALPMLCMNCASQMIGDQPEPETRKTTSRSRKRKQANSDDELEDDGPQAKRRRRSAGPASSYWKEDAATGKTVRRSTRIASQKTAGAKRKRAASSTGTSQKRKRRKRKTVTAPECTMCPFTTVKLAMIKVYPYSASEKCATCESPIRSSEMMWWCPASCTADCTEGDVADVVDAAHTKKKTGWQLCLTCVEGIDRSRSKYHGVRFVENAPDPKKPWRVLVIDFEGEPIDLGFFAGEEEAAQMYDVKARECGGSTTPFNHNLAGQSFLSMTALQEDPQNFRRSCPKAESQKAMAQCIQLQDDKPEDAVECRCCKERFAGWKKACHHLQTRHTTIFYVGGPPGDKPVTRKRKRKTTRRRKRKPKSKKGRTATKKGASPAPSPSPSPAPAPAPSPSVASLPPEEEMKSYAPPEEAVTAAPAPPGTETLTASVSNGSVATETSVSTEASAAAVTEAPQGGAPPLALVPVPDETGYQFYTQFDISPESLAYVNELFGRMPVWNSGYGHGDLIDPDTLEVLPKKKSSTDANDGFDAVTIPEEHAKDPRFQAIFDVVQNSIVSTWGTDFIKHCTILSNCCRFFRYGENQGTGEFHMDVNSGQVGNILICLNGDYEGGNTLLDSGRTKVPMVPRRGYIWRNVDQNYKFDKRAMHTGSLVRSGEKRILVMRLVRSDRSNLADWLDGADTVCSWDDEGGFFWMDWAKEHVRHKVF